jgi:hypothetical protein
MAEESKVGSKISGQHPDYIYLAKLVKLTAKTAFTQNSDQ